MEWIAIIGSGLTLIIMIFKEFFSEASRRREADKTFKADEKLFFEVAQRCIDNMRERAKLEAKQAQSVEDQVDSSKGKP